MTVSARLVGFDKRTELLSEEHAIPTGSTDIAKAIAGVPDSDPDVMTAYPLTEEQVRRIAEHARLSLVAHRYDFFLEASAD